ncbi:UbiD family decarboxylase [Methanocella conradii HZ254]|uniref:Anhydromevalonate phosphate decarboxylase n=1 Tax=Methanocella conradii (strain DSM 24694 / JCM 17849 / CGMCC 1.5162 / HZ254) TaxID=1041930 RepID=H8I605_METCZ|nr:UbiD family decarboxylase [Methanocella conradii]AFD00239.1 UbiD family decarboxylase [Methanocella conradii HZ254]MDI6895949.1 UbiD family decarboxylase [Methanocella conradii]
MGLREFLELLRKEGSLLEINKPISPIFEAPRYAYQDRRTVLFNDCNGMRAVMNVLNSREALAKALGVTPGNIIGKLTSTGFDGEVKRVDDSPMFQVKSKANLSKLPIMKHFKKDGGAYITAGIVVSKYKDMYNASIHRLMVVNDNTLAARLVPPRHTYVMHKEAAKQNEPLQVGIVIGVDPVTVFAASTRVPQGKEWEYAAALKGEPIELVTLDNGVEVPHGEIVLEGSIDPVEKVKEGPFVDITGSYDHIRPEPVIHLTNMMMRKDPIYHGILPGGNEHKLLMGVPYEPLIYNAVANVTKVKNVVLTEGGCCYLHAIVQIEKQTEGDGKNAIMAAFAAHTSLKHVVVVDSDIDIFDPMDVEYAIATRTKADRDVMIISNVRGSSLDPVSEDNVTSKMGIDATKPLKASEKYERAKI